MSSPRHTTRPVRLLTRALALVVSTTVLLTLTATASSAAPGDRVDLRVLVVTNGGSNEQALARQLADEGVPTTVVQLGQTLLTPSFLSDTVNGVARAKFQAVVLPGARGLLSEAERTALSAYEIRFGVREVNAYVYPGSDVGTTVPTSGGPLDGRTATVTPAGLADPFRYLRGTVSIDDDSPAVDEVYGYLGQSATSTATTSFTPLVTVAGSPIVGTYSEPGREQLVIAASFNSGQLWFRTLAHGMITWMTRGVHLGYQRNYFAVQVDDVLLPDARWSIADKCTPGDDCRVGAADTPDIRMVPSDVSALRSWQTAQRFPLDLAFNAGGSVDAIAANGSDPLTTSLLSARDSLRWLNHTYSHQFLGCLQDFTTVPFRCRTSSTGAPQYLAQATVRNEVRDNILWARRNDVPLQETDLVTGEHSGLAVLPQQPSDNPALAPVFTALGIRWTASDASRESAQRTIGTARTVMRHPMNIFYNVAKKTEQISEYNAIYTSAADGGKGICNSATSTCIKPLGLGGFDDYIVPVEARIALGHVLSNDPRPHYAHQSNLAEDRILYPVLDRVLSRYRGAFADNADLVNLRLGEQGAALQRAASWAATQRAGSVTAWVVDGTVTIDNRSGAAVPLTVPAGFGSAYGGERSGWTSAGSLKVVTGQGAFGTTTPPGTPASPTAPTAPAPAPQTFDTLVQTARTAIEQALRAAQTAALSPTASNRAAADTARDAAERAARALLEFLSRPTAVQASAVSQVMQAAEAVPTVAEAVKAEAVKAEAVKAEAVKAEAVKAEAVKAEAVKAEAVKAEAVKAGRRRRRRRP